MPVRRAQFPANGRVTMFRRLDYGSLLRVHLLDTRQYRTDQTCGKAAEKACRQQDGSPTTMLGADQEAWLDQGLDSPARWNLLAQQVMVMPFLYPESRADGVINQDAWSGYPDARRRLVDTIQRRRLTNVVVATGDVHKHHAGIVPLRDGALDGPAVASEYVCSSISSGGDGSDMPKGWEGVAAANPHTKLLNDRRGYQLFDIRNDEWRTEVIAVDQISRPGGRRTKVASLVTVPERPGVELG